MRAVSVKVLKKKLKKYLRLVAEGDTVLVIQRDRVVGQLVPAPSRRGLQPGAFTAESLAAGPALSPALPTAEPAQGAAVRVRVSTPPWL